MAARQRTVLSEVERERHIRMEAERTKRMEKNEKRRAAKAAKKKRSTDEGASKVEEEEDSLNMTTIDRMSWSAIGDAARGPFDWVPGKGQSWSQYMANARMFGAPAFQKRLPPSLRGPLPDRSEVESDPKWEKLIAIAWDVCDDEHGTQSVRPRAPSPSHAVARADWLPYVTFWPSEDSPDFVILSNRLYTPPAPRQDVAPQTRRDCREGLHERYWVPQWLSSTERRHLAFIPMKTPQGLAEETIRDKEGSWYFKTHSDPGGQIGWYRLDWSHCESPGVNLWRIGATLRDTVHREALSAKEDWITAHRIRTRGVEGREHWHANAPMDKINELKAAMSYLLGSATSSWELRGALVAFQRCILEIRGFLALVEALENGAKVALRQDNSLEAQSQSELTFGRRDSRGIFVLDDQAEAEGYARYGVPVWYCRPYTDSIAREVSNRQRGAVLLCHGKTDQIDHIDLAIRPGAEPPRAYLALATLRGMGDVAPAVTQDQGEQEEAVAVHWRDDDGPPANASTQREESSVDPSISQHSEKTPSNSYMRSRSPGSVGLESADTTETVGTVCRPQVRSPTPRCSPTPPAPAEQVVMEVEGEDVLCPLPLRSPTPPSPASQGAMEVVESSTLDATDAVHGSSGSEGEEFEELRDSEGTDSEGEHVQEDLEMGEDGDHSEDEGEVGAKRRRPWRKGKRHNKVRKLLKSVDGGKYNTVHVKLSTSCERDAALPEWWPYKFDPASIAAKSVDDSREREVRLAGAAEHPVPQDGKATEVAYKMPRLSYLTNAWAKDTPEKWKTKEENVDRALHNWLRMREHYLAHVEQEKIGTDNGFSTGLWRSILKNLVYDTQSYEIVQRLGLSAATRSSEQEPDEDEYSPLDEKEKKSLREVLEDLKASRPLTFNGHALPAPANGADEPWLSPAWRSYVVWELSELEFRYELLSVALWMRRWYPTKNDLQRPTDVEYLNAVKDCWSGGIEGLRPAGNNWLCSENPGERLSGLRAFAQLIRMWPRGEERLQAWEKHWDENSKAPTDEKEFAQLELSVWAGYAQLYYDHRGRRPPLPHLRPEPPFEATV